MMLVKADLVICSSIFGVSGYSARVRLICLICQAIIWTSVHVRLIRGLHILVASSM